MSNLAIENAVVDHRIRAFRFLPGKPGDLPSINFRGYEDTGFWYNPNTKSIVLSFDGVDVYTFDDAGGLTMTVAYNFNSETGIVAFAGGGQASATALSATKNFHRITTCATLGDSVKLPPAFAGGFHLVINAGAAACQVFGTGTDTVDTAAAAVGNPQMASSSVCYSCTVDGAWSTVNRNSAGGAFALGPTLDYGITVAGMVSVGRVDVAAATKYLSFGNNSTVAGYLMASGSVLAWTSSATDANGTRDLFLLRDAAQIAAFRAGATAQSLRIYRTFTDASNYERLNIDMSGTTCDITQQSAGTGTVRVLRIFTVGASALQFGVSNSLQWEINTTGALRVVTDVGVDLGDSTHFVKDAYYRRRLTKIAVVTYSASMTPDASLGDQQVITVTNGTAFTINAPTNPLTGQWMELMIRNTSGGAVGVVTWNAVFKMAAWTSPATAFSRSITFRYDGTNWVETGRTTADVPN